MPRELPACKQRTLRSDDDSAKHHAWMTPTVIGVRAGHEPGNIVRVATCLIAGSRWARRPCIPCHVMRDCVRRPMKRDVARRYRIGRGRKELLATVIVVECPPGG